MMYKIYFHPEAAKEISRLDNRVKLLVLKQIKKLMLSPGLGKELGNHQGVDLTGYRKLYADKKRIRIVYRLHDEKAMIQIFAIGKREGLRVYKKAAMRVQEKESK